MTSLAIRPLIQVRTAPPMIAITMSEPTSLVLGLNSLMPSARVVGNTGDKKKLVSKIAHSPTQPGHVTPIQGSYPRFVPNSFQMNGMIAIILGLGACRG